MRILKIANPFLIGLSSLIFFESPALAGKDKCLTLSENKTVFQDKKNGLISTGTLLIKKEADGKLYVFIGKQKKPKNTWSFPAGHCDEGDPDARYAAARETAEETGDFYHVTVDQLSQVPAVHAPKFQRKLFVIRDDNLTAEAINAGIAQASNNKNLNKHYFEVSEYRAIPLKNLLRAAKNNNPKVKDKNGNELKMKDNFFGVIVDCRKEIQKIAISMLR